MDGILKTVNIYHDTANHRKYPIASSGEDVCAKCLEEEIIFLSIKISKTDSLQLL